MHTNVHGSCWKCYYTPLYSTISAEPVQPNKPSTCGPQLSLFAVANPAITDEEQFDFHDPENALYKQIRVQNNRALGRKREVTFTLFLHHGVSLVRSK